MKELKEMLKSEKTVKILIYLLVLFVVIVDIVLIVQGSFFYKDIIKPSYYSVKASCMATEQTIEGMNQVLATAGYVVGAVYIPSNDTIEVVEKYRDNMTMKHEECHREQHEEDRYYNCNNPLGKFLNEVECYWVQYH